MAEVINPSLRAVAGFAKPKAGVSFVRGSIHAAAKAGSSNAARMAMIAITNNNSMSVKAGVLAEGGLS